MDFDLNSNACPYDPLLHSRCVSTLKEYGDYYQVTVSKMVNDVERTPLTERQQMWMEYGLTRSEALWFDWCFSKNLLGLFGSDFEHYAQTDRIGRFISNVMRSRKTLDELGNCNRWDCFVTFTIDPQKFDSFDLSGFYKKFSKWINNYKRLHDCKFGYVFVPELHQSGAWHLHGLIKDLPFSFFTQYDLMNYYPYTDVKLPKYIRDRLLSGETLYYWQPYVERFGWCVIEPLRSAERASSYIAKYIGKGFASDDRFKNVQMIKSSVGLKRAVKLKKGFTSIRDVKPSFDCDYATTFKFPKNDYSIDDVLKYFL